MASFVAVILLVLPAMVFGAAIPDHMIDMTHGLKEGIPIFPGITQYNFTIDVRGSFPGFDPDIYVEANTILLSEHTATHHDAPAHYARGRRRTHQIPIRDLVGPGAVIDISEKAAKVVDSEVLVEDLIKYEKQYGQIPNRAFVFSNAGWEKHWSNYTAFMGADRSNHDWSKLHWPGFSLEATKWLVEKRDVIGIGSDSLSIEAATGLRDGAPVHRYILGDNRLGFEMVANLSNVPPAGATIYAFPMKIIEGSGGPVRMIATWSNSSCGLQPSFIVHVITCMAVILLSCMTSPLQYLK